MVKTPRTVTVSYALTNGCNDGMDVEPERCLDRALDIYRGRWVLQLETYELAAVVVFADEHVWACGLVWVNGIEAAPFPD